MTPPRDRRTTDEKYNDLLFQVEGLRSAFPTVDGVTDFAGHRNAHEGMMRAAKAQEEFWSQLRLDLAKKGAVGLIMLIGALLLLGISAKLGVAPYYLMKH